VKAPDAREADALWNDLGSTDAAIAFRAMTRLGEVPEQAPALLRERAPRPPFEAARVQQWLAALDHDEFAERGRASEDLVSLGEDVRPVLEKALAGKPSPEVRRRLERALDKLGAPRPAPSQLRLSRAVEVLERISSAEAGKVLEFLAAVEQPAVTREAAAAL